MSLLSTKFNQRTFKKMFTLFSLMLINMLGVSLAEACQANVIPLNFAGCAGQGSNTGSAVAFSSNSGSSWNLTGPSPQSGIVPPFSNPINLPGLLGGNYTFTVNASPNPCSVPLFIDTATVTASTSFLLAPTPPCDCNGTISLQVTGTHLPPGTISVTYIYTLTGSNGFSSSQSTAATTAQFLGLCGANYTWTVQAVSSDGESECTPSTSGTVNFPGGGPTPIAAITGNTSPYNTGDTVNLLGNPSSVTPPGPGLTYLWTGPNAFTANTQNISFIASALTAGVYTLTVCNPSNGATLCCTTTTTLVTVNQVCDLAVNVITTTPPCVGQANGVIQVTITGGTAPFSYQLDGGAVTPVVTNPFSITGIAGGAHSITVTDSSTPQQCTTTQQFTVTEQICCNLVIDSITPVTPACFGQSNGVVTVAFSGGTGPFFYQVDGGAPIPAVSPFNISGLTPGAHTLLITDSSTPVCSATTTFTVQGICCLVAQPSNPQPSCANAPTGSVDITVSGQSGQVEYSINGGVTFIPVFTNPFTVTGLPAGTTIILVRDGSSASCDPVQVTVTLDTRPAPIVTITGVMDICGTTNPTLTANPTGGAGGPYTFLWTPNGETTQTINVTAPGTYGVTVTDAAGCTGTNSAMVNDDLTAAIIPANPTICPNGSVLLTALPTPSGTFNYQWSFFGIPITGATASTFLATLVGTYSVTITDPNFPTCTATVSVDVTPSTTCGDLVLSLCCKKKVSSDDDHTRLSVTITNIGSSPVSGIVATDLLPSCFTFKKGIGENWTFVGGQPVIATFNGVLQPGESTTFTLCVKTNCAKAGCSGRNSVLNQVTVTGDSVATRNASCIIKIN